MDTKVKGLVIGETKLGDNKKYIRVLTDELGLISVIVHGATGVKSRHLAAVRPFTYSSFVLTKKRDSYTLKEAEIIKSFFALGADPKILALASYIVSAAGYVSAHGDDMSALLSLTLNSLYALAEAKKPHNLVKAAFELKCAAVIGFAPALIACAKCGGDISGGAYLHIYDGDTVCEHCKNKGQLSEYEVTYKLTPSVVAAMRYIEYSDIKKIFAFTVPDGEMNLLSEICENFLTAHIETVFPALKVYKSL